jgi:hypothetical protein
MTKDMIFEVNQEIADLEQAMTNPNLSSKKIFQLRLKIRLKRSELRRLKKRKDETDKTLEDK